MKNLQAEMARYEVSISAIATIIGCTEKTLRNKIAGNTDFTYPEAHLIYKEFFPNLKMEYLFASDTQKNVS